MESTAINPAKTRLLKSKSAAMEKLPNKTYYAKEIKAHTGYALDKTVYKIKAGVNKVKEDFQTGKIKINKSAEDGIISGRKFKITYSYNGKSLSETAKTNAKGIATFDNLKVYDMSTGKAITYTVSEINVDTKNVKLTDGDVDLTINVKFNNELKTGSIKINKQSEDNQNGGREFTVTGNGKTYSIKTGSDGVLRKATEIAARSGYQCKVYEDASCMFADCIEEDEDEPACIVTIGGDGTTLRAVSHAVNQGIEIITPILGINLGKIGFFSETSIEGFEETLKQFSEGDYTIETDRMLKASFKDGRAFFALNDFLAYKSGFSSVSHIELGVDGADVGMIHGDGIIVSSRLGSTVRLQLHLIP